MGGDARDAGDDVRDPGVQPQLDTEFLEERELLGEGHFGRVHPPERVRPGLVQRRDAHLLRGRLDLVQEGECRGLREVPGERLRGRQHVGDTEDEPNNHCVKFRDLHPFPELHEQRADPDGNQLDGERPALLLPKKESTALQLEQDGPGEP